MRRHCGRVLIAWRRCLERPPTAVFLGSDLGVIDIDLLARKIRHSHAPARLRLVRLADAARPDALSVSPWDATSRKSFDPTTLLADFETLVRAAH